MNGHNIEDLAKSLLGKDCQSLTDLEAEVLDSIANRRATELDDDDKPRSTFGTRLADRVAEVGGSWGFIIAFAVVLFGWMFINSSALKSLGVHFDPYPFIFLNLMLSTLAAIQAPIIMMSQNRQSEKDRLAAAHDYQVNLRAELEVILLHEKLEQIMVDLDAIKSAVGVKDVE